MSKKMIPATLVAAAAALALALVLSSTSNAQPVGVIFDVDYERLDPSAPLGHTTTFGVQLDRAYDETVWSQVIAPHSWEWTITSTDPVSTALDVEPWFLRVRPLDEVYPDGFAYRSVFYFQRFYDQGVGNFHCRPAGQPYQGPRLQVVMTDTSVGAVAVWTNYTAMTLKIGYDFNNGEVGQVHGVLPGQSVVFAPKFWGQFSVFPDNDTDSGCWNAGWDLRRWQTFPTPVPTETTEPTQTPSPTVSPSPSPSPSPMPPTPMPSASPSPSPMPPIPMRYLIFIPMVQR